MDLTRRPQTVIVRGRCLTPRSTRRGPLVARRFRAYGSVVGSAALVATGTGRAGERVIRWADEVPGNSVEHPYLELALLWATIAATAAAVLGTAFVYTVWRWTAKRTRMLLLSWALATVLLAVVYVLANLILFYVTDRQVNPPVAGIREFGIGYTFIHPGIAHILSPAVGMLLTWALIAHFVKRRSAHPARPNSA